MRRFLFLINLIILAKTVFSQDTIRISIPNVKVYDSSFSYMLDSVIAHARECAFFDEFSCSIISLRYGLTDNESYFFITEPFDDVTLYLASIGAVKTWRVTIRDKIPIVFFYNDTNKFEDNGIIDFRIDLNERISYYYVCKTDTVDLLKQTPFPLRLRDEYNYSNGTYVNIPLL